MKPLYAPEALSVWEWTEDVIGVVIGPAAGLKNTQVVRTFIVYSTHSPCKTGTVLNMSPLAFSQARRLE